MLYTADDNEDTKFYDGLLRKINYWGLTKEKRENKVGVWPEKHVPWRGCV